VCERIPYLILSVRQLSSEPFGSRRSVRRYIEPNTHERAAAQVAGPVQTERSTKAQIRLSAASGMTVDWEGDGRIRKGLESLGGR